MSNNPLKQYFRRPVLYIKLPSGSNSYTSDILEKTQTDEFPVYPMTTIDEITSKTPDALYSGQAVVDIIRSCIPNILNPWEILSADLNTILIAIRIASNGEEMTVNSTCPACQEDQSYDIDLSIMLADQQAADFNTPLKTRDLEIKFNSLTYFESNKNNIKNYELQKSMLIINGIEDEDEKFKKLKEVNDEMNDLIVDAIAHSIEFIKTPEAVVTDKAFIKEFLLNSDRNTSKTIREYSFDLGEKSQLKPMKFKCANCSHEYEQQIDLNISSFFD